MLVEFHGPPLAIAGGFNLVSVEGSASESMGAGEVWRRRVGVEPTNPLLAGSLVLKTRRATGPIPPPRSLRIAEGVRCCPSISAVLRLGLQRIAVGVSIELTTRVSLSPDLTFDTMR